MLTPLDSVPIDSLTPLLKRYWGYEALLPNQAEAIACAMTGQDSLVILPTGGGKSLGYQLPAIAKDGMAIVVSPLLSLMQDQVQALVGNGIPAATLNSNLTSDERRQVVEQIRTGHLKLLYVSPERLAAPDIRSLLASTPLSFIAIDEAHCISQWGHEFRPDYRNLGQLREWFPDLSLHAFTATATDEVRADIIRALGLREPRVIVGDFDRPNLTYRVQQRRDLLAQIRSVLDRHPGEAGILYCIRRADVDSLCAALVKLGYRALPYHAGLGADERRTNQAAFSREETDLIVATVAFGMGIDRSNVRFVIHAGMPKSIENYQQEAGRAGRDRLAAECILFHSAQDAMTWRSMYKEATGEFERSAIAKIEEMSRFCRTLTCRHRFLVQYFGQAFPEAPCGACDVCLAEHASLPDATTVARKILSGVARVQERYGARHVAEVLKGAKSQKLLQAGHDRLSTYGLLAEHQLNDILDWIDQLIGHGHLVRAGDYPVLQLTPSGRTVMRGELDVVLTVPKAASAPRANRRTFEGAELSAGEEALFQHLRAWRRELAQERGVPPYLILGDVSLRELALTRPATVEALRGVRGIGEVKARDLGDRLLSALQAGAAEQGLALGAAPEAPSRTTPERPNATRETAFAAFAEGRSIAEVAAATGRSPGTIEGYLLDFIGHTGRTDPAPWLDADRYRAILETAESLQAERLKPIFEALHGEVPYGNIRLAMALRANQAKESVLDPLAPPR